MHRRIGIILALAACALATGCGATREEKQAGRAVTDYLYGDYARAVGKLRPLAQKTDENYVLNNARLGSAALADYDLDQAEAAFLAAYDVINAGGVNKGGRDAAAVLINEKHKIWKGEPFEKAMVNFYLGLVYYMRHDYENARAAFENSLFKLRDYGEEKGKGDRYEEVESDFALGYLMLARCHQRLGNDDQARKNYEYLMRIRPNLRATADPTRNARSNVLLVIDFGYGPKRVTEFDGSIVAFAPSPGEAGPAPLPRVIVDGRPTTGPRTPTVDLPPTDLLALAQERRWQSIDTIRTVKSALGTGLIAAGAYEGYRATQNSGSAQRRDATAAAALIAAGLLLKATSQGDVRTWEMLPRSTFVVPLELPPGKHDIIIDFPDAPGFVANWRGLAAPSTGEATYYMRVQRYNSGPFIWPPRGARDEPVAGGTGSGAAAASAGGN